MQPLIIPYNPKLKELARKLRKESTLGEVLLWNQLKGKQLLGYELHFLRFLESDVRKNLEGAVQHIKNWIEQHASPNTPQPSPATSSRSDRSATPLPPLSILGSTQFIVKVSSELRR
jgi:very-short-patch-repair endonuclease